MEIKEERIGLNPQVDLLVALDAIIRDESAVLSRLSNTGELDLVKASRERVRRYERLRDLIDTCDSMYVRIKVRDGQANDLH